MLLLLAVLLGVAWLLGLTVFKVTSVALHALVLFAIVSIVVHFARGGRTRAT